MIFLIISVYFAFNFGMLVADYITRVSARQSNPQIIDVVLELFFGLPLIIGILIYKLFK